MFPPKYFDILPERVNGQKVWMRSDFCLHNKQQQTTWVTAIVVAVVVSHVERIGHQPEKLLYMAANPAPRGMLNRGKRTKGKVWKRSPPPPHNAARSEKN